MELIQDRKATELNSSSICLNILLAQRCRIIKYLWSSMQVLSHPVWNSYVCLLIFQCMNEQAGTGSFVNFNQFLKIISLLLHRRVMAGKMQTGNTLGGSNQRLSWTQNFWNCHGFKIVGVGSIKPMPWLSAAQRDVSCCSVLKMCYKNVNFWEGQEKWALKEILFPSLVIFNKFPAYFHRYISGNCMHDYFCS